MQSRYIPECHGRTPTNDMAKRNNINTRPLFTLWNDLDHLMIKDIKNSLNLTQVRM